MEDMGRVYAGLDSYKDQGYVHAVFHPGKPGESTSQLKFSTYFCRPYQFKFEWVTVPTKHFPEQRYVIWSDGKHAYAKYPYKGEKVKRIAPMMGLLGIKEDLSMAVAGATGISMGAAHTTAALLMPGVGMGRVLSLSKASNIGDELVGDENCHHFQEFVKPDERTDLWISQSRNVLLQIYDEQIIKAEADPLEKIEENRFRSIGGLVQWLQLRQVINKTKKLGLKKLSEPLAVHRTTIYENVELNPSIAPAVFVGPDEVKA